MQYRSDTKIERCPKKIRPFIAEREAAGFINRGGKGSHRNHRKGTVIVVIAGRPGDDAKRYQERDVEKAIKDTP